MVTDERVLLLGGGSSTFSELPIRAVAGETITNGMGADQLCDGGVTWQLDDLNPNAAFETRSAGISSECVGLQPEDHRLF